MKRFICIICAVWLLGTLLATSVFGLLTLAKSTTGLVMIIISAVAGITWSAFALSDLPKNKEDYNNSEDSKNPSEDSKKLKEHENLLNQLNHIVCSGNNLEDAHLLNYLEDVERYLEGIANHLEDVENQVKKLIQHLPVEYFSSSSPKSFVIPISKHPVWKINNN